MKNFNCTLQETQLSIKIITLFQLFLLHFYNKFQLVHKKDNNFKSYYLNFWNYIFQTIFYFVHFFMSSQKPGSITINIYISGKDVSFETREETKTCGRIDEDRQRSVPRPSGGKRPPYGLPPTFFDDLIEHREGEEPYSP